MSTQFVDELPGDDRFSGRFPDYWRDLSENPGQWALWPGSHKSAPAALASAHSRNGVMFEGARREGRNYFRCVA